MPRAKPARLVNPMNGILQEELRHHGVPSGRDRSLEAARQKRADAAALKPRVVEGNIKDGTALKSFLQREQDKGNVIDETQEGGSYGDESRHPVLINTNEPGLRDLSQSAADTTSTTNLLTTVSLLSLTYTLPDGKWDVRAKGSTGATHSSNGSSAVSIEIDSNEGTVRTYTTMPSSGGTRMVASHNVDDVVGGRDITVRVRGRSETSGTTSFRNPELRVTAKRVE